MANLHVHMIEDTQGDLVDIEYYCGPLCANEAGIPEPSAWPGGMETGHDQSCNQCGRLIAHGMERDG